jgi:hypothetical protein
MTDFEFWNGFIVNKNRSQNVNSLIELRVCFYKSNGLVPTSSAGYPTQRVIPFRAPRGQLVKPLFRVAQSYFDRSRRSSSRTTIHYLLRVTPSPPCIAIHMYSRSCIFELNLSEPPRAFELGKLLSSLSPSFLHARKLHESQLDYLIRPINTIPLQRRCGSARRFVSRRFVALSVLRAPTVNCRGRKLPQLFVAPYCLFPNGFSACNWNKRSREQLLGRQS